MSNLRRVTIVILTENAVAGDLDTIIREAQSYEMKVEPVLASSKRATPPRANRADDITSDPRVVWEDIPSAWGGKHRRLNILATARNIGVSMNDLINPEIRYRRNSVESRLRSSYRAQERRRAEGGSGFGKTKVAKPKKRVKKARKPKAKTHAASKGANGHDRQPMTA